MWIFIIIVSLLILTVYLFTRNCQTITSKEGFSTKEKITILVFLSSGCPHCVTYKNNTHSLIEKYAKTKGHELKLVPENDSATFTKYNIMYIPSCIIVKGDKHEKVKGEISESNIEKTIKNM